MVNNMAKIKKYFRSVKNFKCEKWNILKAPRRKFKRNTQNSKKIQNFAGINHSISSVFWSVKFFVWFKFND